MKELGYSYSNTYEQGLVIIDNTRNRKIYLQKFFGDEMRIELKYMNELSKQAVLLTENKIGSLDDLNTFRTKLEDEVRTLKGTRESLQRKKKKSTNQEDLAKFDEELKILAPKIKQLNTDIQNCYKIEKRTILWQKEYDKVMEKEQERQKQEELKQSKKKSRKYLR